MVEVSWSDRAISHLNEIFEYIAIEDPIGAERLAKSLIAAAQSLEIFPRRGRPAPDNARELTKIWPYVIRYEIAAGGVVILSIFHGARNRTSGQ
jgi:toxin ParE1/3/4